MDDMISRQQAIDGFYEMVSDTDHLCTVGDYISFLESLSAQPGMPERCEDCANFYKTRLLIPQPESSKTKWDLSDCISRNAAIDALCDNCDTVDAVCAHFPCKRYISIENLPPVQPEGYIKIPETGIDDLSDGSHTFRQLYYQRMMLFATIVKQNKDKAWKSLRHEDGEPCFGGGWFIVGIDTPEGSYTYHYEDNYFSLFDCEELEHGKHWDGHTEKDVTRLLSLPSVQSESKRKWYMKGYRDAQQKILRWVKENERGQDENI